MDQQQIDLGAFAVALIGQQAGLDVVRLQCLCLGLSHQLLCFFKVAGLCLLQSVERRCAGITRVNDQHHGSVDQFVRGHCHSVFPPYVLCSAVYSRSRSSWPDYTDARRPVSNPF